MGGALTIRIANAFRPWALNMSLFAVQTFILLGLGCLGFTEGRMMQLRKHYEDRRNKHQEEFNAKQEEMLKRIQQLETENATEKNSNQEAEDHKRKGKARREMDVDHVIKDYDKNIREANYNINETAEAEAREQKQLKELKDHFGKVNAEHDA